MLRWYLESDWRARTLTDERRDCLGRWILRLTLTALVLVFVGDVIKGQSQDYLNATAIARMDAAERRISAVEDRLDRLDDKLLAGLVGLVANLAVHLLQLGRKK